MRPMRKILIVMVFLLLPLSVVAQPLMWISHQQALSLYKQVAKWRFNVEKNFTRDEINKVTSAKPFWKLAKIYDTGTIYEYFLDKRIDRMKELYVRFNNEKVEFCYQYYDIPKGYFEHQEILYPKREFTFKTFDVVYCSSEKILIRDVSLPIWNMVNSNHHRVYELYPITQQEMKLWEEKHDAEQAAYYKKTGTMPPDGLTINSITDEFLSKESWVNIIASQNYEDKEFFARANSYRRICLDPHLLQYSFYYKLIVLSPVSTPPSQPIATMRAEIMKEKPRRQDRR